MQNYFKNYKNILFYLTTFFVFYILSKADIGIISSPFSYAIYFSLLFCGINVLPLSVSFLLANLINGINIQNLTSIFSVVLFALLVCLIYKKTKKQFNIIVFCGVCFLSALPKVYFSYINQTNLLFCFVSIFVGIAFMLCCINISSSIHSRGLNTKLTLDEYICSCVVLVVFCNNFNFVYLS